MTIPHDTLVWFAKTFGLFYLIAMSVAVVLYVYSPSKRDEFGAAAKDILDQEDRPWR